MSLSLNIRIVFTAAALALGLNAMAEIDPLEKRHELMEDVGKAAKPIGKMFKGEREYDPAVVLASLQTFEETSMLFGRLFPPGSETGGKTEAAPAIWEDRAGFEEKLTEWRDVVKAAIAANPQTLEEAKPTVGRVFKSCKGCHDTYRIKDE